jgi:anaphase-promoting complex subunit 4
MAPTPKLGLFSSSKLSTPVSGGHLACNPVIDLTATVGDAGNVLFVWRANDQLVSKHTERNQKALAVKWKEDGGVSLPFFFSLCAPCLHFTQVNS